MHLERIDEAVEAAVVAELLLLKVSVRQSPEEIRRLLHSDFLEFDPTGGRWDRASVIDALASQQPPAGRTSVADIHDVKGLRLSEDVVFLTYITEDGTRRHNRSSIWRKTSDGWRLYFHQGTTIP